MPAKIINIQKNHEDILFFLFPNYSLGKWNDRCIFSEDIKTQERLNQVRYLFKDSVIISRVLYDEMWDVEKISEEVLKFCRVHFGCRKRNLKLDEDTLVEEAVEFIGNGGQLTESVDEGFQDLFEAFGTRNFPYRFFTFTEKFPVQVLTRAMLTFLTKVATSATPFHARYGRMFGARMRENLPKALDFYLSADKDPYGIYFVRFCQILVEK